MIRVQFNTSLVDELLTPSESYVNFKHAALSCSGEKKQRMFDEMFSSRERFNKVISCVADFSKAIKDFPKYAALFRKRETSDV